MVGAAGFEPATLWSQTRCATRLRYAPIEELIHQILIISKNKNNQNKAFLQESYIQNKCSLHVIIVIKNLMSILI